MNKNIQLMGIILLFSINYLPTLSFGATQNEFGAKPKANNPGINSPRVTTEMTEVDVFIKRAQQMKLGDEIAWLNLLHYKSTLFGERRSQVDDSAFFLHPNGDRNPQAELEADLQGFFNYTTDAHARCRFPARFNWLDAQLKFSHYLPEIECNKFNNWKETFTAEQVTLLFPSMFLENPASMFGHTFIRFDRPDKNHLLSYTLSYAAAFDESDNTLVYAWKGITGGYTGKFYLQAYFETLQEYSDIEQRDIWEYTLNLNKQEVDQLVRHLWEVKGIHFEYYFLRENCSFRLLALLDVARENINMSIDAHPVYAVPVDTVRDIERAGLITERNYRPAKHNRITQMSEQVESEISAAAFALVKDEISIYDISKQFTEYEQVPVYQISDEIISQYKNPTSDQLSLQFDILSARSRIPVTKYEFEFRATPPEQSHQSARWQLSAGKHSVGDFNRWQFYEIGLRPVLHDLLDETGGFLKGASINVLETQFRWYQDKDKLELEKIDIFSLESIVPVTPWDMPLSKKLSFQIKQRDISIDNQITEFEFQFSMGYARDIKSVVMYAMAQTQFEYATELYNNHALYLGLNAGILWQFDSSILSGQTEIEYQLLGGISGEDDEIQRLNIGIQFNIVKDHALRLEYEFTEYELFEVDEGKLSYLIYF